MTRSRTRRLALVVATVVALPVLVAASPSDRPAGDGVHIADDVIVVETEQARATVTRDPFGIAFSDPSTGDVVLEHVAPPGAPGAIANLDPEGGGFDSAPETAVYAPLAYVVGAEYDLQHPVFLWTGNMLTGVYAGIVHHATEVTDAIPWRGGVRMTVATTEPGRTLTVDVTPDRGSSVRLLVEPNRVEGIAAFSDSFVSGKDESFRGFGGRRNTLDQRGHDFYNWVEEENIGAAQTQPAVNAVPGSGDEHYEFPNGQHAAYYVQNLFVSSRPYGFLLNSTQLSRWRMAADQEDAWQVMVRGQAMDYTVAVGDAAESIDSLTRINGRHRVNPLWAMGPMLKRNVQQGSENPESYMAKIRSDLENIEKHGLAGLVTGYAYEGWDGLPREFIRETNAWLLERGIRPVGYVRAYVNDDGMFDRPGTFQDAVSKGLVVKTPGGAPFLGVAAGPAALLDFTNPATVRWWAERKILEQLELGFDGFMQDFGEQVLDPMVFHDGRRGHEMHNVYPTLFHRTTRAILDDWLEQHPGHGDIWMYTRAGFSGRRGSAAYESANFPGDETTDWQKSTGLPSITLDMLNRGIGGAYGYTTDIGGYFDSYAAAELDDELFARWSQWSSLTPFYRLHNSCCSGTKMPWDFGDAGFSAWRKYAQLHVRALPYLQRLWREAQATGMPITRPMWLALPNDPAAENVVQQWMLGRDILVAPVVTQGATSRDVYFPSGTWIHGETGQRFTGPGSVEVPAPVGQLPWFVRAGTNPLERR